MIQVKNISDLPPYKLFLSYYNKAHNKKEENIEAMAISSYNKELSHVDSRYVNIKFVEDDRWVFFTNYNSPKAKQFKSHDQISGLFFWKKINVQIRIKGKITILDNEQSDIYFQKRSHEKNALAISSRQSEVAYNYQSLIDNYNYALKNKDLSFRPKYWGGYSFTPYEIEFWEGNEFRLNKRNLYRKENTSWNHFILEP